MCLNELLRKAWENPGHVLWFISPTHNQARLQYERLIDSALLSGIIQRKHDSLLRARLINGSDIVFKSGEVKHRLRGATINGVVIDEVRDQPQELWGQVIRPMLTTTKGWAAFVSTPRGFDAFYDLFQKAISNTTGEWFHIQSPSTCNPMFTQAEFDRLRSEMVEYEFLQEVMADFRSDNRGSAYQTFSPQNQKLVSPHVKTQTQAPTIQSTSGAPPLRDLCNPFLPLHLACDWNVTHLGWVISQFRHGVGHYAFDEIYLQDSHTQEGADVFVERFRGYEREIGTIRAEPQVLLIGDATGDARKTSAGGNTDFTILENTLRKAGITFKNLSTASNPTVKDRVNTMNSRLKSADGTCQAWLNPVKCPKLKRDMERVTWKQNATGAILDQTTDPSLTHLSDAWGYDIFITNPIQGVGKVGGLRVIRR